MGASARAESSVRSGRSLLYFPIVHTPTDMGALRDPVRRISVAKFGRQAWERNVNRVEQLWTSIEATVAALDLHYGTVKVYQDGLPNCGRELEIVAELAKAGSRNHQLLVQLKNKGAQIMGTESPDLLLAEYKLMEEIFSSGDLPQSSRTEARQEKLRRSLLERRDQYIGERINQTLSNQETGILFLGRLHSVAGRLDPDIRVAYPVRPLTGNRRQPG